ncbi:MAG: PolC-type DNA polymerase III [Clostridia bacterium]
MGDTPGIMQRIKVRGAKINRLSKKITVELQSDDYVFLGQEKELEGYFKSHFETDNLGVFCTIGNAVLGEDEKKDIIDRLVDFCPTLAPYAGGISVELDDGAVLISLPDVCDGFVKATGAVRHISEFITKNLKLEAEPKCRLIGNGNGRDEYIKIKQELEQKTIAENGKISVETKHAPAPERVNNYRKKKKVETVRICDLGNEYEKVAFFCEVINFESRITRSGKTLLKFDATDYTSSITCKMFTDEAAARELRKLLQPGNSVEVEGKYSYDSRDGENIIMVRDINECEPLRSSRQDGAEKKRVELHLHTKMSAKDGFIEPAQLFRTLSEWGHEAVAITDHGVVQAFPEAAEYAEKYGIKAIYGVEGYLVDNGRAFIFNPAEAAFGEKAVICERNGGDLKIICIENGEPGQSHEIRADAHDEIISIAGDSLIAYMPADKEDTTARILGGLGARVMDLTAAREALAGCRWLKGKPGGDSLAVWKEICDAVKTKGIKSENELCIKAAAETVKKTMQQHHVVILARNGTGLKSLYEMISVSHLDFFYKKPRIPKSLLDAKRLGLVIGSACEAGELYTAAVAGADDGTLDGIASFYDYLEIQPVDNNSFMVRDGKLKNLDDIRNLNKRIDETGIRNNIPVAATCDAHFFDEGDAVFRKIIMHGMKFKDVEYQAPLYMRTTGEMLDEFAYLGSERAYSAVVEVPAFITSRIEKLTPIPKKTFPPVLEGSEDELRKICMDRVAELYGGRLHEKIESRLNRELDSIISNGFAVMYIIAQKLAAKSIEQGYLVGSRGSVGSSFAAFLAGITEVNPLEAHYICRNCKNIEFADPSEYDCGIDMPDRKCPICGSDYGKDGFDIPFETFLGFDGDKMPDIDQNFSGEYQALAHKHVEELFGSDNVFKAGTISTIADKTAYGFVKGYLEENGIPHNKAEINRLVKGCAGVKRTTGQHPGGMVVLPEGYSIYDFTPVQRPADDSESDTITTHFDFNSMHDTLLKLDILGHDDPTVLKMLEDLTGTKARDINIRDEKIMSLFRGTEALGLRENLNCSLGVLGIPEFGTGFVRGMLETAVPGTISELLKISGLSHGENVWRNNAEDLIKSGTATLQNVISIRDDIMLYLMRHGMDSKMAFTIMEKVRKKFSNIDREHEKAMLGIGIPGWYVESCKKIEYMFPKAHAAAYVIMALRIAWYKIYYPMEYYTAYFSIRADEFEATSMAGSMEDCLRYMTELRNKDERMSAREQNIYTILEIVAEMYARGIKFNPVDIRKSLAEKFIREEDGIRLPLVAVGGIGAKAAHTVVVEREKKEFTSLDDLRERGRLTKSALAKLQELGAVDGLPGSSQGSFFD